MLRADPGEQNPDVAITTWSAMMARVEEADPEWRKSRARAEGRPDEQE